MPHLHFAGIENSAEYVRKKSEISAPLENSPVSSQPNIKDVGEMSSLQILDFAVDFSEDDEEPQINRHKIRKSSRVMIVSENSEHELFI